MDRGVMKIVTCGRRPGGSVYYVLRYPETLSRWTKQSVRVIHSLVTMAVARSKPEPARA